MNKIRWVLYFYFDDDPFYAGAFDQTFKTKKQAVRYVEKNLSMFFPFARPANEKILKMEDGNNVRWRYETERVELKPQVVH